MEKTHTLASISYRNDLCIVYMKDVQMRNVRMLKAKPVIWQEPSVTNFPDQLLRIKILKHEIILHSVVWRGMCPGLNGSRSMFIGMHEAVLFVRTYDVFCTFV